jgi:hypothetical protein
VTGNQLNAKFSAVAQPYLKLHVIQMKGATFTEKFASVHNSPNGAYSLNAVVGRWPSSNRTCRSTVKNDSRMRDVRRDPFYIQPDDDNLSDTVTWP